MTNSLTTDVRKAATWSIVLSVLMIAAGVLTIGMPMLGGIAVTALVGWLLVFSGILHLAFAWRSGTASAVLWEVLVGIAYGAIGFYTLSHPIAGLAALTLAIAAYLLLEGVLELLLAFQFRSARTWFLIDGIITLLLAAMIWSAWPSSAEWVVGTLVGISMLFSGITRLMMSSAVRRIVA